jgi:lipoate-protein ligase B
MTINSKVDAYYLGEIAFAKAITLQHSLARTVEDDNHPGAFLFLEHPPVITLGKHADKSHVLVSPRVLKSNGIGLEHTDRGGGVTFHDPGQIIFYPIFRVRGLYRVPEYVEMLQKVAINTLAAFGIESVTRSKNPGVWIKNKKISSIGIRIHNGVATHGLSLNVSGELKGFKYITACNDPEMLHTTLQQEARTLTDGEEILGVFTKQVEGVFRTHLSWRNPKDYKDSRIPR